MKDRKNTFCDQCIYETKTVKLSNEVVMPVEIWVGCENEQCEFKKLQVNYEKAKAF